MKSDSHQIKYCESTRNIDNMLQTFKEERNTILQLLQQPNQLIGAIWSILSRDTKCLCNMGRRQTEHTLAERLAGKCSPNSNVSNYYMCSQCHNMSRLTNLATGYGLKSETPVVIDQSFHVECGRLAGQLMILQAIPITSLFIGFTEEPKADLQELLRRRFNGCGELKPYLTEVQYLGADAFTNQMLISWYLDDVLFKKLAMPHIVQIYTGFVCRDTGYVLEEYPDIGKLDQQLSTTHPELLAKNTNKISAVAASNNSVTLKTEVARGILIQLFALLKQVQTYDFCHGDISTACLNFAFEVVSYEYEGVSVECPITLKLDRLTQASITIPTKQGPVRLYNRSPILQEQSTLIYTGRLSQLVTSVKESKYQLKHPDKWPHEFLAYTYLRHLGVPLYQSSYDAYACWVVLMTHTPLYEAIVNDETLFEVWRSIWSSPEQAEDIEEKLQDPDLDLSQSMQVFKLLQNYTLNCQVIDQVWSLLTQ